MRNECKRDLNASRALLVIERIILKKEGHHRSLVAWPRCGLVYDRVECKRELNASRALLVLERIILKRKTTIVQFGSVASVRTGIGSG